MPSTTFDCQLEQRIVGAVRERRLAGSGGIRLFHVAQPRGEYGSPPHDDVLVALSLTAHRNRSRSGNYRFHGRWQVGQVFATSHRVETSVVIDDDNAFLMVLLPPSVASAGETDGDALSRRIDRLNAANAPHAMITPLIRKLWLLAHESAPADRLLADAAIALLAHELIAREPECGPVRPRAPGLAPWQVRRVTQYLQDDLARETSLVELARLARLSPHHFCRAFRQTMGQPPHRWLAARRIEKAQQLLLATDHSVLEIALAVGYQTSSHFSRAFRAGTGASPSEFRRDARS